MNGKNEDAMSEEIIVLGAVVKKSVMPEIFRLTTANKAALERTVKSMMEAQGFKNAGNAMAMLESDLGRYRDLRFEKP